MIHSIVSLNTILRPHSGFNYLFHSLFPIWFWSLCWCKLRNMWHFLHTTDDTLVFMFCFFSFGHVLVYWEQFCDIFWSHFIATIRECVFPMESATLAYSITCVGGHFPVYFALLQQIQQWWLLVLGDGIWESDSWNLS